MPMFLLRAVVVAGITVSSAMSFAKEAGSSDARMFKCSPALTGACDGTAPKQLMGIRFVFHANAPVRSTPLLYRGRLYFGSSDGTFYAVDAESGRLHWETKASGPVSSSAAAKDGIVYVVCRPNVLYALNSETGAVRWRRDLGADKGVQNYWDFFESSPVLDESRLFVGSGDGRLYAFEADSGRQLWSYDAGSRIRSTPAVSDHTVVFGAMNGSVYAV